MTNIENKDAKPFLKWAGGKRQLLKEIKKYYPFGNKDVRKYIEPFVGGGAVLFDILNKYDLDEIYINDANLNLINTYMVVKNNVEELILLLNQMQNKFLSLNTADRKNYYLCQRRSFNNLTINTDEANISKAAIMIFLNKTCFNGLYRVNKKCEFNVPMGSYKNPVICDENNLRLVSEKLQKVKITYGDYKDSIKFIDENTFVYIDPPYRPLASTSNFTSYTENHFDDKSQEELALFVRSINKKGAKILISNSDTKDGFFNELYKDFKIQTIKANRMINCKGNQRNAIDELLISNF